MSDDLVKRLREGDEFERFMLAERAAARIEELEAKLAKAVGLIQFLDKEYQHAWGVTAKSKVRTTLAELKGDQ